MSTAQHVAFVQLGDRALEAKARDGGLKAFTTLTMHDYEWNWHHQLLCRYLNKFIRREIRRLMVFMPPRYGKSELVSRRLPAMLHGIYPDDEIMLATYNSDLATEMTSDVQSIMDSESYRNIFPFSRIMPPNSSGKYSRNANEHDLIPVQDPETRLWHIPRGTFKSAGIGGSFTGKGADWILIDDPIKGREDADSKAFREKVWKFYSGTLRTRLEGEGSILLTHTRWHEDDLAGRIINLAKKDPNADQWTMLLLPALREDMLNPEDPRALGDPLWPSKFSMASLLAQKAQSERDWTSQYQQRPAPAEGGIIKRAWIKYYKALPDRFDEMIQSWDLTFKGSERSDFVVGQVWARIRADRYLVDQFRARVDFPETVKAFRSFTAKHPKAYAKIVEAKANGQALIDSLKREITGIIPFEPRASKEERLSAVSSDFEAGNVWIPDPSIAPWVHDYVSELCGFPSTKNDDQVDATTQALLRFRSSASDLLTKLGKM